MSELTPILSIIIAGLMNGSFVMPAKSIKNFCNEKIWLYHSIIGLIFLPWIIYGFILPHTFQNYLHLSPNILFSILASGTIFGLGQIWFAKAIETIGIALSFAINLGIGLVIGSMFVILYKSVFFTERGFLVTLAVLVIILSLILYYQVGKVDLCYKNLNANDKFIYTKGWRLAFSTGITSGLQNITFFLCVFQAKTQFQTTDSFWIWPPFLLAAAIPMFFGFRHIISQKNSKKNIESLNLKNLISITMMGLFFTGSLALYGRGMSLFNQNQQIIGWPTFIVSIIFASQIWGLWYKEDNKITGKNMLYRFFSVFLLVIAVIILTNQV